VEHVTNIIKKVALAQIAKKNLVSVQTRNVLVAVIKIATALAVKKNNLCQEL